METNRIEPTLSTFDTATSKGAVSALHVRPENAAASLVLGHGSGANMRHPLIQSISDALNGAAVATFRFNYPYSEKGGGMDAEQVRLTTARAAMAAASRQWPDLPLFAGGHSMSGRMISMTAAAEPVESLRGIVFFSFPLHTGKPDAARAEHLRRLSLPLLFFSGERDTLADWALLTSVVDSLGARATLHQVDTADHGFKVLKRRVTTEPVMDELARVCRAWIDGVIEATARDS